MKNTFYILIALLLLMVACGRPSGNAPLSAELQRAEDLMYPHPDSALHILQAMTPPKDELNHATCKPRLRGSVGLHFAFQLPIIILH